MEKNKKKKLVKVRIGKERRYIEIGDTLQQFRENFLKEFKLKTNNSIDYILSCKDKANRIVKIDKEETYQELKKYLVNFPKLIEPYFTQKQSEIHNNSKCMECGLSPIIGIKYQCMKCANYELCSDCEKNLGEKHGHPLLKLRKAEYLEKFKSIILPNINENNQLFCRNINY